MLSLHRQGVDYLPRLIEEAHKDGIRFFASFRMNDAHQKSFPNSMLAGKFWQTHQHYRLWEVTDGKTYYNATLDYSYPEVRRRMLDAIGEVVQWYDVDGIELDWCRNPYTFPPSEAWDKRDVLTRFTEQIRNIVDAAGRKKGRKLSLIVRIPFSEETHRKTGMDVATWIRGQTMEILVMSNRVNDYTAQVGDWPGLCRENGILFFASVEAGPAANAPAHNHVVPETAEQTILRVRAAAQNWLAQDVDGIYMFNYPCKLFERKRTDAEFKRMAAILSEIGSPKTMQAKAKQYTFWQDLPIHAESGRPPQYHQTVSFKISDPALRQKSTEVVLRFRQVAERNPHATGKYEQPPVVPPDWVKYLLNDKEIDASRIKRTKCPAGKIPSGFTLKPHELIEITIPPGHLKYGENTLAFHIPRYPEARDPYVYIYELTADVAPKGNAAKHFES